MILAVAVATAPLAHGTLLGPWGGTSGGYSGPMNPAPVAGNSVLVAFDGQSPMYQYVSTTPGQTYELDWYIRLPDLGGNGLPIEGTSTTGPAQFNVTLPGSTTSYLIQNRDTWAFDSLQFVATSTSSYVSWWAPSYVTIDGYFQPSESVFLNDYSLNAIPEPEAWEILLAAAAAIVCWRRWSRSGKGAVATVQNPKP
jgi:hypothetical protein